MKNFRSFATVEKKNLNFKFVLSKQNLLVDPIWLQAVNSKLCYKNKKNKRIFCQNVF